MNVLRITGAQSARYPMVLMNREKGDSSYDQTFTPEGIWKDKSGAGCTGKKGQRVS